MSAGSRPFGVLAIATALVAVGAGGDLDRCGKPWVVSIPEPADRLRKLLTGANAPSARSMCSAERPAEVRTSSREMFETGSRYAQRRLSDVREVQRSPRRLTAAGIQRDRALQIMLAAGDLGAPKEGKLGARAITKVSTDPSEGGLQMEELQGQLEAGLSRGDVIAEIGSRCGPAAARSRSTTQVRASSRAVVDVRARHRRSSVA